MPLLSVASQMLRAVRHRRAVRSLTELDDRVLDALARPYFVDPSKALKDACCNWRTFASRFCRSSEPVACC